MLENNFNFYLRIESWFRVFGLNGLYRLESNAQVIKSRHKPNLESEKFVNGGVFTRMFFKVCLIAKALLSLGTP